jgi:hypothetical protein
VLEELTCTNDGCGIMFAVPREWKNERRNDHKTFYCPNGHSRYFPSESELEQATRLLARERARHDQTQAELKAVTGQRNAARSHASRIKNRAEAGVCIHCNRTFKDLADHMKTKHVLVTK